MEKVLKGLEGVICLTDDILIYGKTATEHWVQLQKVLEKIEKSGMTLRKEKCEFGKTKIKFIGHVDSSHGFRPDPDKVQAIKDIKAPVNKTEARRFTGMVNYLMNVNSKLARLCTLICAVSGSKAE